MLAKNGDPNDADVAVVARPSCVGIVDGCKSKRGDSVEGGAPPVDHDVTEGRDDVTPLGEARRLAINGIEPVDRDHRLEARRRRVYDVDAIAFAKDSEDEAMAVRGGKHGQG